MIIYSSPVVTINSKPTTPPSTPMSPGSIDDINDIIEHNPIFERLEDDLPMIPE